MPLIEYQGERRRGVTRAKVSLTMIHLSGRRVARDAVTVVTREAA